MRQKVQEMSRRFESVQVSLRLYFASHYVCDLEKPLDQSVSEFLFTSNGNNNSRLEEGDEKGKRDILSKKEQNVNILEKM